MNRTIINRTIDGGYEHSCHKYHRAWNAMCKGFHIPESEIFVCGIRILESWALEYGIQLKELGIVLTIRIQNPSSTNLKPVPGIDRYMGRLQCTLSFTITECILVRWLVESYGLWEYRPWKWRNMSRSVRVCLFFCFLCLGFRKKINVIVKNKSTTIFHGLHSHRQ